MILPCYNEEETIEGAIKSILAQKVNRPMEIMAVENNSTDDTFRILQRLEKEHPEVRAASTLTRRGYNPISEALNYGISLVRYPIIVRLDADTQLGSPMAIEESSDPYRHRRSDCHMLQRTGCKSHNDFGKVASD